MVTDDLAELCAALLQDEGSNGLGNEEDVDRELHHERAGDGAAGDDLAAQRPQQGTHVVRGRFVPGDHDYEASFLGWPREPETGAST